MAYEFYMGRPGSLVELPQPTQNPQANWERRSEVRDTIGGGRVVDFAPGGNRTWSLEWEGLESADHATLMGFFAGHNGVGPWVLVDPQEYNLLSVNQSSATSALYATTGWTVSGVGGTIASGTSIYKRGPRAVAWSFSVGTPGASLLLTAAQKTGWTGVPVVAGLSYVWSAWVKGSGADAVVDVEAQVPWYTSAGVWISSATGATVTTSAATWQRVTAIGVAPATAAYGIPRLSADSATIGAGSVVNVDEPMFGVGTAAPTAWMPGLGVPLVSLTEMPRSYPRGDYWDMTATLVEVG